MIQLRDFQFDAVYDVRNRWARGDQVVMPVLPVGTGKTVVFSYVISQHNGASCAIAHRQELVAQMSVALARFGVRHRIIGPKSLIKFIVRLHQRECGASFFDAGSPKAVAGVDTLLRQAARLKEWLRQVTLWITDEGHHLLRENKWGRACELFPDAQGMPVTATPERADGKGLGRAADGIVDSLVEGPSLRDMIDLGWLTDYQIYAPPSDLQVTDDMIGATGDYSQPKLTQAARKSHIVGDTVDHYRRLALGRRGVTFATDVETALNLAAQYAAAGVPAQCVSAKTEDAIRAQATQDLRDARVLQLTNVDLFGEGYDLPAIDCVSMARPTASFPLFVQQAGRALRPLYAKGMPLDTPEQRRAAIAAGPKPFATIIDHVQNVRRHAVARHCKRTGELIIDICYREWSLEGRQKRSRGKTDPDAEPLTNCLNPECLKPYSRFSPSCPYCGHRPEPGSRSAPEFVEGDLDLLDPAALHTLVAEKDRIAGPARIPQNVTPIVARAIGNKHLERQQAQARLRETIDLWAGYQRAWDRPDSQSYRRFWHTFGVDVLTAQTQSAREMDELRVRIESEIARWVS